MRVLTSGRAAGSQITGVMSGGASGGRVRDNLVADERVEHALCSLPPLPTTRLTLALGLLECLQEPVWLIKAAGKKLVFGRRGELNWLVVG